MQKSTRVRHLLRRYGLGASPKEVRNLQEYDLTESIERVIDYEAIEEPFPFSPWEFLTNDNDDTINTSGQLVSDWWALRMATTTRPLEERMALFWHDHFAVSDFKIQDARKMVSYIETIRRNATGNFVQLLEEASKEPAMILFLDSQQNIKGAPNENFAREVMELFTLGVDNGYTEEDIRESARAFTGWYMRDTINYRDREKNSVENQIREKVRSGQPVFEYGFAQNRHDDGEKTIFGKKGNYSGEQVLKLLIDHPGTAEHICRKLWEWFAYPNPAPGLVEQLAKVFVKSGYEIKPVLREIALMPEFWGDRSMWQKVKSPVDFTIGLVRSLNAKAVMEKRQGTDIDLFRPMHPEIKSFATIVNREVRRQGLYLLHPPSVEGWHWGKEWITTESMLYRIDVSRRLIANRQVMEPLLTWSIPEIAVEPERVADAQMVDRMMNVLDVNLDRDQRYVLSGYARKLGLNDAFYRDDQGVGKLSQFLKIVFAMPEMHVC